MSAGRSDEYVEKLVADAYRRELDQEENVFRSMPFFATALGVLATAIGLARPAIGPLSWQPVPVAIHLSLVLLGGAILLALMFLYRAVRLRDFKTPMGEMALIAYRRALGDFYAASNVEAATIDDAVLGDLRETMVAQVAQAAALTRANNLLRLQARSRAATSLLFAIFLAFVMLALILVRDAVAK